MYFVSSGKKQILPRFLLKDFHDSMYVETRAGKIGSSISDKAYEHSSNLYDILNNASMNGVTDEGLDLAIREACKLTDVVDILVNALESARQNINFHFEDPTEWIEEEEDC